MRKVQWEITCKTVICLCSLLSFLSCGELPGATQHIERQREPQLNVNELFTSSSGPHTVLARSRFHPTWVHYCGSIYIILLVISMCLFKFDCISYWYFLYMRTLWLHFYIVINSILGCSFTFVIQKMIKLV